MGVQAAVFGLLGPECGLGSMGIGVWNVQSGGQVGAESGGQVGPESGGQVCAFQVGARVGELVWASGP